MPGTTTTGSSNIAVLDSKIIASICEGKFVVDISPSQFIEEGFNNVVGANVEILNPFGIAIKEYGPDYDIVPPMDGTVEVDIPTQGGAYQYGKYTIKVKLFEGIDEDTVSWEVVKTVELCPPDKNNKTKNYGSLSATLDASCTSGKMLVRLDQVPNYNGKTVNSKDIEGTLLYPTVSQVSPLEFTLDTFSVQLYEGEYKVTADVCATYSMGDNVWVDVLYKVKASKHARCILDKCCVLGKLVELNNRLTTDCTQEERNETASITVDALRLLTMADLAANCGEDPSDYVADLEALLGCKCTCHCNEGAPIAIDNPSSDVVVQGCNVESAEEGLTKVYTINNYSYRTRIVPNGGALIISAASQEECEVVQEITFDIGVVYDQIKQQAVSGEDAEAGFWASIINATLNSLNVTALGITSEAWEEMTFAQRIQAIINKVGQCCSSCDAEIVNATVTQVGADVKVQWKSDAYSIDVYLDGQLVATYLSSAQDPTSSVFSHTFVGAANGQEHEWMLVPRCADKSSGTPESGSFTYIGCPVVTPVVLTEDVVNGIVSNVSCPFDLDSLVDATNPETAEWHTANNTQPGSIVSNPAAVSGGTYYVFNKNGDGCYSVARKITVICASEGSCTAPQNLLVSKVGVQNYFIQFQSAAYPPPGNSYTVKRRLATDPDVGGSYTTIGTPVWNAGLNRWVIADVSAVDDTLYVYRAISNCGSSEPYVDFPYVNVTCPSITLTPDIDKVDYSFIAPANANQIKVQIYDSTGVVKIHEDTYTSPHAIPLTGTFSYLDSDTTYKVRLVYTYDGGAFDVEKTCGFQNVTTSSAL